MRLFFKYRGTLARMSSWGLVWQPYAGIDVIHPFRDLRIRPLISSSLCLHLIFMCCHFVYSTEAHLPECRPVSLYVYIWLLWFCQRNYALYKYIQKHVSECRPLSLHLKVINIVEKGACLYVIRVTLARISSSLLSTFDCYYEGRGGGVFEEPNHMIASKTGPLSIIQYSLVRNLPSYICSARTSVADPWHFGVDPCLWLLDPDPAIFVIDLQDANKKLIKKIGFLLFEGTFT